MNPKAWSFPRAEALPVYAFVAADEVKARVRQSGADLIDLGLGNPDRATDPAIVAELGRAAAVGENHRYHPGRGLKELREALRSWYQRRYAVSFDVEREIVVTMGAKEGISHLCLAILGEGDLVVVPDPCYPIHRGAALIADADVLSYRAGPGVEPARAVSDAIQEAAREGRVPKLVVANYPHNPTGQVVTREELAELVRVVEASGAMLLHDLAYADLDFQTRFAPSVFDCGLDPRRVSGFAVEVFSMSKSYTMPGWRIGFMAGNERMIGALSHLKTYVDYGTFIPVQRAAAWALSHGDEIVTGARELYRLRAKALSTGLRAAGWDVDEPSGTMFVWSRLPEVWARMGSLAATKHLIENAHVVVSPGNGFGAGGEGSVRFALIEDPPRIEEACMRVGKLLANDLGNFEPRSSEAQGLSGSVLE